MRGRAGWRRAVALVGGAVVVCLAGCRGWWYRAPAGPMPPKTVLLSTMMSRLSEEPGFTEGVLDRLNHGGKNGAALMTPKLIDRMRKLILGKDWQGLDRFPGWTMGEITPTVRLTSDLLLKPGKGTAEGAEADADAAPNLSRQPSAKEVAEYLTVGDLALDRAAQVDLDRPAEGPGFPTAELVKPLGYGVVMGDGPDPALAPEHAESARLAELLNRMSVNGMSLDGPEGARVVSAMVGGKLVEQPEALMRALIESGHTVRVFDARYFANFGHFHDNGAEVMMPFWVDTRIRVPGTGRSLLVPVSHAEFEWQVRGPRVNADVAFYYGIDGHAEWRTMDERNQAWVLGRHAHAYDGAEALEVTRLAGEFVVAYVHQHVARPKLPFGGYYTLGVCQDAVSAVELKLTGKTTLFPNTADARLFDDARDAEVNGLLAAIPKDREGKSPAPERVFGSLPTEDPGAITIPGLGEDVRRAHEAWQEGRLRRLPRRRVEVVRAVLYGVGFVAAAGVVIWLRRRRR